MAKSIYLIKNVELNWAKLNADSPVSPFGTPIWEIQVVTKDEATAKEAKQKGINFKKQDDGTFKANLKRDAVFKKTGEKAQPVVVVDGQMMPVDGKTLGNGSVGNVQVTLRDYEYAGKSGVSVQLKAIQVTKLVEYTGGGNSLAFDVVGETEVVTPEPSADSASDSPSDLWD